MKIKKTTALVAAILAGTAFASAQEMSVSAAIAYESEYIFRGVRLADDFIAPSVDVSYGDMYIGIWAALPVENEDENEVDIYAGYGFEINELVSADVGFTYYTYPDSADGVFDSDVNTFEVYTGFSFEAPLSPAVYAFYDFDLEAFTLEVSGGHTFEVSETTSIEASVYAGYVNQDSDDAFNPMYDILTGSYVYYGAGVAYMIQLSENATFSLGVNYYGNEDRIELDGSSNKLTWATSFSAGF